MVGVRRLTAASAVLGAIVWVALVAVDGLSGAPTGAATAFLQVGSIGPTRRLFLLAPLVVVPLCLGLVGDDVRAAAVLQPPAALLATASVVLPAGPVAGPLALPWAAVTLLLAVAALRRITSRPAGQERDGLPKLLVDAGLLYSTVGSTALVLSASGVGFPGAELFGVAGVRGFGDAIVFLAAVHFHFAGFVVPVVAGVTGAHALGDGKQQAGVGRAFAPIAWVVVVGPGAIGLGITFSPLVEVVAVVAFTTAVTGLAVVTLAAVVRSLDRLAGVLVGVSSVVLPVSMALALAFGLSVYLGVDIGLDIPTMVAWHGHLNALGFALPAALGWRLVGE